MTLQIVKSIHPEDITDELIALRGELAAANRTIAQQRVALANAHAALLSANRQLDIAFEIIQGAAGERP